MESNIQTGLLKSIKAGLILPEIISYPANTLYCYNHKRNILNGYSFLCEKLLVLPKNIKSDKEFYGERK